MCDDRRMNNRPKLIFINGPVGAGKSTIGQRYIDDHKFALLLSSDYFVGSLGQWLQDEQGARDLACEYLCLVAKAHLRSGHDVVLPYMLTRVQDVVDFEQIAQDTQADFIEYVLFVDRDEAIQRALERGTWGEPTSPPVTNEDVPILNELFDKFEAAVKLRPQAIRIDAEWGDVEGTYRELIQRIEPHGRL